MWWSGRLIVRSRLRVQTVCKSFLPYQRLKTIFRNWELDISLLMWLHWIKMRRIRKPKSGCTKRNRPQSMTLGFGSRYKLPWMILVRVFHTPLFKRSSLHEGQAC